MVNSAAVISLGRFGSATARKLQVLSVDVLATNKGTEVVQHAAGNLHHVVRTDATSRGVLE